MKSHKSPIYLFASVAPLTASLIAPLAVLLDIPALTEKWYTRNGEAQPDPRASLILSGLSLGFSIIANALLVIRFSLHGTGWGVATQVSVACWVVKVVTGITNLIVFGALTRNQPQFSYAEGFWCAAVSLIASGIILALLLLHWVVEFRGIPSENKQSTLTPTRTNLQIRVAGRHFMLQNTMLVALMALTALIFSRIENWTYLQGIYFTIVTLLTVGFGDFYPTKPSTKVLLFPLALLGITLLANSISMIVTFFNKHRREHKARARAEREKAWQIAQMTTEKPSLAREITFLTQLHKHQGWREHANDLARSSAGFLVFWFVGAAIFGAVESWSYGDGLYFCFVFFLSIGYGDFAPISPVGRVIFIVYSVLAVPIMASFAVQAIQNVIEHISQQRMDQRRERVGNGTNSDSATQLNSDDPENTPSKEEIIDKMHSTLILQYHSPASPREEQTEGDKEVAIRSSDLKALLEHSVSLERIARRLLVAHLEEGSRAQILLRADWNLQARDLRALESELEKGNSNPGRNDTNRNKVSANGNGFKGLVATEAGISGHSEDKEEREEAEIAETAVGGMDEEETLRAVRDFRKNVAGMLALGSQLRELEGLEKYLFERRRREAESMIR